MKIEFFKNTKSYSDKITIKNGILSFRKSHVDKYCINNYDRYLIGCDTLDSTKRFLYFVPSFIEEGHKVSKQKTCTLISIKSILKIMGYKCPVEVSIQDFKYEPINDGRVCFKIEFLK